MALQEYLHEAAGGDRRLHLFQCRDDFGGIAACTSEEVFEGGTDEHSWLLEGAVPIGDVSFEQARASLQYTVTTIMSRDGKEVFVSSISFPCLVKWSTTRPASCCLAGSTLSNPRRCKVGPTSAVGVLSCTTFWVIADAAPSSLSAKESFNLTLSTTQLSIMLNRASLFGTDEALSFELLNSFRNASKVEGGNLVSKGLNQVVPFHVEHLLQAHQLVVSV